MIRRAAALALGLMCLVLPVQAGVTDEAAKAAEDLRSAVAALQEAEAAKDRVAALTRTIRAYEDGLGALREALRQAELREQTLEMRFQSQRDQIAQLIGVLGQIESRPGPLLLLHPAGPLGTVRSGMILAEVTPALQGEAEKLRGELQELADLRQLQKAAGTTLTDGLAAAQIARTALSKAISERTDLPRRFTDDPEVLKGLLESSDTLEAFASGLAPDDNLTPGFAEMRGKLELPVLGRVIRRPGEADGAGVRRPGLTIATRPRALVTSPWAATIRYRGPLLDYGNVIILEPGDGYLLVISGLTTLYGDVGEVIAKDAPLGLMGGQEPDGADLMVPAKEGGGAEGSETLYMELRLGAEAVDPTEWFPGASE